MTTGGGADALAIVSANKRVPLSRGNSASRASISAVYFSSFVGTGGRAAYRA